MFCNLSTTHDNMGPMQIPIFTNAQKARTNKMYNVASLTMGYLNLCVPHFSLRMQKRAYSLSSTYLGFAKIYFRFWSHFNSITRSSNQSSLLCCLYGSRIGYTGLGLGKFIDIQHMDSTDNLLSSALDLCPTPVRSNFLYEVLAIAGVAFPIFANWVHRACGVL